jgi:hypothetical protein
MLPSQPIDKFIKAPLEINPMPSIELIEALKEKRRIERAIAREVYLPFTVLVGLPPWKTGPSHSTSKKLGRESV